MLKVMIAEDDLLIAEMLGEILIEGGYELCGVARTVNKAVELGERHKPDLAVLDLQLANGGFGTEIAARLNRQGDLGVLYATGDVDLSSGLTRGNGEACLRKPYGPGDLILALKIVEQIVSTGMASLPFPQGFFVLSGCPNLSGDGGIVRVPESPAPRQNSSSTAHSEPVSERHAYYLKRAIGFQEQAKMEKNPALAACYARVAIHYRNIAEFVAEEQDKLNAGRLAGSISGW
jgi:CheY-like chemotaxis protein